LTFLDNDTLLIGGAANTAVGVIRSHLREATHAAGGKPCIAVPSQILPI
jgi:hypothetical protein